MAPKQILLPKLKSNRIQAGLIRKLNRKGFFRYNNNNEWSIIIKYGLNWEVRKSFFLAILYNLFVFVAIIFLSVGLEKDETPFHIH